MAAALSQEWSGGRTKPRKRGLPCEASFSNYLALELIDHA